MSLADWFRRAFLDVGHAAEDVVHFVEKEITMPFSQAFQDALDHIKAALSGDGTLQKQVADLTAASADKDGQIATLTTANGTLTQQLADATQQISDMEAAVIAADPTTPV